MFNRLAKLATLSAILAVAIPLAPAAQSDIEAIMWELVSTTDDLSKVEAFIENFPESEHIEKAHEIARQLRIRASAVSLEDTIFSTVGNVTYDTPLAFGDHHIMGQSLSNISNLTPAYPPIEGLPEEMWKDQSCKNCHNWTRADLCTQANNYVSMDPNKYREKMHPFGGMLKINLRNWAQNDCQ